MAGETAQYAAMADKISKEIFSIFGWQRRPHQDLNFNCVIREHNKKTHPADVVFSYASPMEQNQIFIHTDLKSYSSKSITSSQVSKALNSLFPTVDCANASQEWRDRYGGTNANHDVHGMLFVYNHDNEYDTNWPALLADAKILISRLKKQNRIYVLGPPDISYLLSVADDITRQRGSEDKALPFSEHCSFYYPELTRVRPSRNHNKSATLEMLTSPWTVLRYEKAGKDGTQAGSHCYYRGTGSSVQEFKFLIDYLFRSGLVADGHLISIRLPNPTKDASGRFRTAKEEYWHDHHKLPEFQARLDRITFAQVARVRDHFDETVLDMDGHS